MCFLDPRSVIVSLRCQREVNLFRVLSLTFIYLVYMTISAYVWVFFHFMREGKFYTHELSHFVNSSQLSLSDAEFYSPSTADNSQQRTHVCSTMHRHDWTFALKCVCSNTWHIYALSTHLHLLSSSHHLRESSNSESMSNQCFRTVIPSISSW